VAIRALRVTRTEVTVAQYGACVEDGACTPPETGRYCNWGRPDRDNHPVNCVTWLQARQMASWTGARLPSEVEWEYAARSLGSTASWPWGETPVTCERAVFDEGGDGCGEDRTWPVCSRPEGATPQGLCDVVGNVAELVADQWHASHEGAPASAKAWSSGPGGTRVLRAGGWLSDAAGSGVLVRRGIAPRFQHFNVGFRLAAEATP